MSLSHDHLTNLYDEKGMKRFYTSGLQHHTGPELSNRQAMTSQQPKGQQHSPELLQKENELRQRLASISNASPKSGPPVANLKAPSNQSNQQSTPTSMTATNLPQKITTGTTHQNAGNETQDQQTTGLSSSLQTLIPVLIDSLTNTLSNAGDKSQLTALIAGILIGSGLSSQSITISRILTSIMSNTNTQKTVTPVTNTQKNNSADIKQSNNDDELDDFDSEGEMSYNSQFQGPSKPLNRSMERFQSGGNDNNNSSSINVARHTISRKTSAEFYNSQPAQKRKLDNNSNGYNGPAKRPQMSDDYIDERENINTSQNRRNSIGSSAGWSTKSSGTVGSGFVHPDRMALHSNSQPPQQQSPPQQQQQQVHNQLPSSAPYAHEPRTSNLLPHGPDNLKVLYNDNSPSGIVDSNGMSVANNDITNLFRLPFVFVPYKDLSKLFKHVYNVELWPQHQQREEDLPSVREFLSKTREIGKHELTDRDGRTSNMLYIPILYHNETIKHRNAQRSHHGTRSASISSLIFMNLITLILAPVKDLDGDLVADAYKFCYKKSLLPILIKDTVSGSTVTFHNTAEDRDKIWGATLWWLDEIVDKFLGWASEGDHELKEQVYKVCTTQGRQEHPLFMHLKGVPLMRLFVRMPFLLEGKRSDDEIQVLERVSTYLQSENSIWNAISRKVPQFSPTRNLGFAR